MQSHTTEAEQTDPKTTRRHLRVLMAQFKWALSCRAAGYVMSLGTPTCTKKTGRGIQGEMGK